MYEPSRWQKNILIGKGNQAKGTFLSSKKHLEHFGRTASTKSIFQGTQLFSKKFSLEILLFQENFYRKIDSILVISEIQIQNVATQN